MDAHDIIEIEQRMTRAVADIAARVDAVAEARQIKEYNSDQRKNLLASFQVKFLREGQSASASETFARADEQYQSKLAELAETYRKAEKHLAAWDAAHCNMEAARSALSLAKEQIRL